MLVTPFISVDVDHDDVYMEMLMDYSVIFSMMYYSSMVAGDVQYLLSLWKVIDLSMVPIAILIGKLSKNLLQ